MRKVLEVSDELGIAPACTAVGLSRATYYRHRRPTAEPRERSAPARKLSDEERHRVLDVLHEPRFVDWAPNQIWAQLLDEGMHLCSPRTMYRILSEHAEVRERRNQLRHPSYAAPQLLATAPNQLWSWDITKLLGPEKWTYYYLYVLLDVFSRYVVGWLVAERESGEHAKRLIGESCARQGIEPGQLTVHSDRGGPMRSKALAQLYADLSVTKTHSRPHTSNDNPFSESQFKTLKYRPAFPQRFEGLDHARSSSRDLLDWYNNEHHHSSLALLTPYDVHYGHAEERLAKRAAVLEAAYRANPNRFVRGAPRTQSLPQAVWINPPSSAQLDRALARENEAGREHPAPSVLPPARRSGCSSAEPYPPNGQDHRSAPRIGREAQGAHTRNDSPSHPDCPQCAKPRGLGRSPNEDGCAPPAALH